MSELDVARVLPVARSENPIDRLAALFDGHYDRLYRVARRLTASVDDALDLIQETFLKAARHEKSVPVGFSAEEAWLVRVLINISRDQWRKNSVRKHFEVAAREEASAGGDLERAAIVRTMVWRALDLLPPRRRAIVVMHELEGMAVPAIASLLGISQITVRWHLSMGKRELATALRGCMEVSK